MQREAYRHGRRIIVLGIAGNGIIAAVKLSLGIIGRSAVLVAESVDSFADIGSTIAILVGFRFSAVPGDKSHPHGHGKIESMTALLVGLGIGMTGIFLIYHNIAHIYYREYSQPHWIALVGVAASVGIKSWLYQYTLRTGKQLNSPSIRASAYDHKADVYRLSGVFFGILFAIVGTPILDPVAAIIVSVFIIKVAFTVLKDAFEDLIDAQMPEKIRDKIETVVSTWNPDYKIIESVGRRMGSQYQVNLKVRVGPYVQAVDGVIDLHNLESCILDLIPDIRGVDITADVDRKDAQEFERAFKDHVQRVFAKHRRDCLSLENVEFHFHEDHQEVHAEMFVSPLMLVKDADLIRRNIRNDIIARFENTQVHISIQPASVH